MAVKKYYFWSTCLLMLLVTLPAAALPPKTKTIRLTNGLKIHCLHYMELPLVSIGVVVKNGQSPRWQSNSNVPGFTAQLLLRGCRNRSNSQINKTLRSLGTSIDVSTTADAITFSCLILQWDFEAACSLLTDLLRYPTFEMNELRQLKQQFQKNGQTKTLPPQAHNTVIQWPAATSSKSGEPITRQAVLECYRRYFVPEQIEIFLAGNFTVPGILNEMHKNLRTWTNPPGLPIQNRDVLLTEPQFVALEGE